MTIEEYMKKTTEYIQCMAKSANETNLLGTRQTEALKLAIDTLNKSLRQLNPPMKSSDKDFFTKEHLGGYIDSASETIEEALTKIQNILEGKE